MEQVSVILSAIGLSASLLAVIIALVINRKTTKTLRRITAYSIATKEQDEVKTIERLLVDMEKTKDKRGTVAKNQDGKWVINWVPLDEVKIDK